MRGPSGGGKRVSSAAADQVRARSRSAAVAERVQQIYQRRCAPATPAPLRRQVGAAATAGSINSCGAFQAQVAVASPRSRTMLSTLQHLLGIRLLRHPVGDAFLPAVGPAAGRPAAWRPPSSAARKEGGPAASSDRPDVRSTRPQSSSVKPPRKASSSEPCIPAANRALARP